MEYKCLGCNGPLSFQEATQTMYCFYCDSHYSPSQFENHKIGPSGIISGETKSHMRAREYIKMQTVVCNSCGAKLAVNDVEASSYCAYCGQPSVVIGRVEDYLKPDYIIPFKITEEEAEEYIKETLKANGFLPRNMRALNVNMCRGIYIPYWLFDIYYEDYQEWSYQPVSGISCPKMFYGRASFEHFPADASERFDKDLSQMIDLYDMRGLTPFNAAYLSGFYSDRFDTPAEEAAEEAYERIARLFRDKAFNSFDGPRRYLKYHVPKKSIIKEEYALLPVWFFDFRYRNKVFTAIVNGQTGKVAGYYPPSDNKVKTIFMCLFVPLCLWVFYILTKTKSDADMGGSSLLLFILGLLFWVLSLKMWEIRTDQNKALKNVNHLVNERQEEV